MPTDEDNEQDDAEGEDEGRDKAQDEIARWLAELRVEHRDLDEVIEYLEETAHPDRMKVLRMKKRKLKLKDSIARLESRLIPDLDA